MRELIETVYPIIIYETHYALLHLCYARTLRNNTVLWILGEYVNLVDQEDTLKGRKLSRNDVLNCLKSRKLETKHLSMPDLGFIQGLDVTGIG